MSCNSPIFVPACFATIAAFSTPVLLAQEPVQKQLQNLRQQVEALSSDVEKMDLGGLLPPLGSSVMGQRGVGQAAAKIYDVDQGLSIGGYGEMLFQSKRDGNRDMADAQRAILYVGYKFDDKWVFNSEIEVEHGSTSTGGSVSLEFGYLDYLHSDAVNLRGGLLLSPMGLINQLHEPTAFLAANRPQTEKRIIPTTWREMGFGSYGDIGDFSYQSYLMTSLDGGGFSDSGLRGGRQKGGKAEAEDWSLITRVDYVGVPGLIVGGSFSIGDSGHEGLDDDGNAIPAMGTTIVEAHVDYRTGPWQFRALYSQAEVDDSDLFNASTGNTLAEDMSGYYGEVGFDVMSLMGGGAQLRPFVRYEVIDTNLDDSADDDEIMTIGLNYKPVPQVVIKLDYESWDTSYDRVNLVFGYVF
jgi:hypothetical protein